VTQLRSSGLQLLPRNAQPPQLAPDLRMVVGMLPAGRAAVAGVPTRRLELTPLLLHPLALFVEQTPLFLDPSEFDFDVIVVGGPRSRVGRRHRC